jgi:glyoxylate reductase
VKVLATRRFVGPAWDDLADVEIGSLDEGRGDVEALLVANETVDAAVLDRFPRLRLIANFGVGYDRVDVAECARRGVVVTTTPGVLTAATADLAFALILCARRRVGEGERIVRRGAWTWTWSRGFLADEATGATLGIVGLGRIGSAVARRAEGFGMRVVSTRSSSSGDELDELLRSSDVVSIHAPLTPQTHGLIDARRLALIRDGACIVNTARGEIVDEDALVRELVSGRIRAGLDVFANEPNVPHELLGLENVVLTPHIGSATLATREAMTRLAVDNILAVERGEPPPTPVTAPAGA